MPIASGFAQAAFAGAAVGVGAAAAGGVAVLGAGVCDHARLVAHSETAPAKINPAAIRISLFLVPWSRRAPVFSELPARLPRPDPS
jgi:hypothetical protein